MVEYFVTQHWILSSLKNWTSETELRKKGNLEKIESRRGVVIKNRTDVNMAKGGLNLVFQPFQTRRFQNFLQPWWNLVVYILYNMSLEIQTEIIEVIGSR